MNLRRALTATLAVATSLALPATALATTQTAHGGQVAASFSFTSKPGGYSDLRLTITRAGTVAFDAPVSSRSCTPFCGPLNVGPGQSSVQVVALQRGAEPAVVISLFTDGAHCCVIDQVYGYDAVRKTYAKAEHDFGDAGATLENLDHDRRFEFVSADNSFYYAFAPYVASGAPVEIWAFRGGRFFDVTRSYPKLIRTNAALWWSVFTKHLDDGEGLIAAWAADEDLLGHQSLVGQRLDAEARHGHLRSQLPGVPTGQRFVTALERFLRKLGYTR